MENTIQFAGLSGSLRTGSYNTMLLHAVQELLPEGTAMHIVEYADVPFYNADLDAPAAERPPSVKRLREELTRADGLIIVSPEYNYSIPGPLKNAIDWASRGTDAPLLRKPVAVMGATPGMWGTVRMQLAFLPVFQYLDMKPVYKPEILIAQASTKFDKHGKFNDEQGKDLIRQKLRALKEMVLKSR